MAANSFVHVALAMYHQGVHTWQLGEGLNSPPVNWTGPDAVDTQILNFFKGDISCGFRAGIKNPSAGKMFQMYLVDQESV